MTMLFSYHAPFLAPFRHKLASQFMMSGHFYRVQDTEKLAPHLQNADTADFLQEGSIVDFTHFDDNGEIMLGLVGGNKLIAPENRLLSTNQRGWVKAVNMGLSYVSDENVLSDIKAQKLDALFSGSAPSTY